MKAKILKTTGVGKYVFKIECDYNEILEVRRKLEAVGFEVVDSSKRGY